MNNNTWRAVDADGTEHIKMHNTVIYKRTVDGTIMLDSGGYRTVTTKARINTCLEGTPFSVYQENCVWYLWNCSVITSTPFFDGMTLQA